MAANASPEQPWYTQTWFVILVLWIFLPAGLILMWTQTTWHVAIKWVATVLPVIWVLLIVGLIFSVTIDEDSSFSEPEIVTPVETFP